VLRLSPGPPFRCAFDKEEEEEDTQEEEEEEEEEEHTLSLPP